MEQPLRPPEVVDASSRLAGEISRLREEVSGLERTMPTTVVQSVDPTGANVMSEGTLWVNDTTARIFVSTGAGGWVSADAQRKTAFRPDAECTTSTGGVALGGPTVDIWVPPNGIVGFWVDAELQAGVTGSGTFAAVLAVYDAADIPSPFTILQTLTTSYERRISAAGTTFGSAPPLGGWVVHRASPGAHTYRAAYASAGGGANVCFRNRRLWVATF